MDPTLDSLAETPVFRLADRYVVQSAALDPIWATGAGIGGHDDELTDYSPEGIDGRAELARQALVDLAGTERSTPLEERAAAFMTERLATDLAMVDADESVRQLNNIASPVQEIRQVFDLMAYDSEADWEVAARRLARLPESVTGLIATYEDGRSRGVMAARRQALEAAQQASTWAGRADSDPFFADLVAQAEGTATSTLMSELSRAATSATDAYGRLDDYLRDVYAPAAPDADAVGADRYELFARAFLGADIDLAEAYEWAWDELGRIETDMVAQCGLIRPGATISEVVDWLDHESELVVDGTDALRDWLQQLMDGAIDALDGTHFDIAEPVRRVEAMIAPPGGASAMYYTGPSEDFSRPGRTWYPANGATRFPLWSEMSTAYHEGVPGHHLQVAQVVLQRDQLSRFQRLGWISGHGEGWALYAERLMDELGFLDRPEYRMGMLAAQALRAVRVIIDIGMHLTLEIPVAPPGPEPPFHPGERWTPELGRAFLYTRSRHPESFMASEIVRYLGWPAQAISYKLGERVWLEARTAARRRHGNAFDLKAFHAYGLDLGPLGLDQLRAELADF